MKTLVITIEECGEDGYPLHLFLDEGDDPNWFGHPRATSVIPKDLVLPKPPCDPVTGHPLAAGKIRELFLNEAGSSPRLKAMGDCLFQILNQGVVGQVWADLRARYPREQSPDQGLRTILHVKPRALRRLPWELMCYDNQRLFIDPANPFVRGHNLSFVRKGSGHAWPIRALIVVGCRADDSIVRADEEVDAIEDAFKALYRMVEWEVLRRPRSKLELIHKFSELQPHIFHFIGHGAQASADGQPILEFYSESDDSFWEWTVDDIVNGLAGWAPRFAFINACRSSDPTAQANAWAITDAFIKLGTPAVLGMQANIRGDAAARFASGLYRALARGESLDCALAKARQEVSNIPDMGLDRRDWSLASLLLSVMPEQVLPMQFEISESLRRKVQQVPEFAKIRDFVDRKEQRRSLWYGVDPIADQTSYRDLLVVVGEEGIGKTSLVHWCLEGCALRGRNLIYVDANDGAAKNFLDILRLMRDGDPRSGSLIRQPLKPEAFYNFNGELNRLLKGEAPRDSGGSTLLPVRDEGSPLQPGSETLIPQVFSSFRAALVEAAGGEPLILALDHLKRLPPYEFKNYLGPYLISYIAQHRLAPVRMILVLTSTEYQDFDLESFAGNFELIKVPPFERNDFSLLANEYFRYHKVDLRKASSLISATEINIAGSWKPEVLRKLRALLETLAT